MIIDPFRSNKKNFTGHIYCEKSKLKSVDPSKLKLKAGNNYFTVQHSQSDASPSVLAESLYVLWWRSPPKTNKTFKVKLIFEGLPSLLKDPWDPKDLEVARL